MTKKPFLCKFATELNETSIDEPQLHFDEEKQVNIFEDGSLSWFGVSQKRYSNVYTSNHAVPAHYTPSGKWVQKKVVPGKTDRRAGK